MLRSLLLSTALCTGTVFGQRVLHFTETSGFDHNTRSASFQMFSSIGDELMLDVVDAPVSGPFSDFVALSDHDVIIFSNTSGNAILDAEQRTNFETWVANGGHVLGIHAASDTYRHSTANGNNSGTWDYFAELIGASVQEGPNHVSGTPAYELSHLGLHPSTTNLPDPWLKNEEYYYWEGGYFGPENNAVLQVEETVGPNGLVNSYDAERPMSWYRVLPNGSRVFYTALGHAQSNYTSDELFRTHLRDALLWLLDGTTGHAAPASGNALNVFPNPASRTLTITTELDRNVKLQMIDATGRVVLSDRMAGPTHTMDLDGLSNGIYFLRIGDGPMTCVRVTH
ncbi:MAG: ThuA domain-containing protein [Flavobacteriales bacterium]|nr:ThuA domain-containing protein [Flavobacteriales bacterium]